MSLFFVNEFQILRFSATFSQVGFVLFIFYFSTIVSFSLKIIAWILIEITMYNQNLQISTRYKNLFEPILSLFPCPLKTMTVGWF